MKRLLRIVLASIMVLSLLPVNSFMSFAYANEQNYYEILSDYINAYELCVNPNTHIVGGIIHDDIYPNVNGEFILAALGRKDESIRPKYYLKDLDYDGVPELFIGVEESTYAVQSNQHLYGVYTYKNGKIITIFDNIGYRTQVYLLDDNSLWSEGSASWQSFYGDKSILSGEQCVVTEELVTYENDVWYYNGSLISRARADEILQQNRNKIIHIDWSDITPEMLAAEGGVKKLVLSQSNRTNANNSSDYTYYTYYENGNLRSYASIGGEGSIYEYDADGRLVLTTYVWTDERGNVIEDNGGDRAVYQYDSAGRWISYDSVYGDYTVKINLEYDGAGRIKKISRQAAGFNAEYSYRYNDLSNTAYVNWQQTTSDGSGDNYTSGSYSLTYDNTGRVLEITGDDRVYALETNIFGQEYNRPTDPLEMYKSELKQSDNTDVSYDSDGDPIRVVYKNSGIVREFTYKWIRVKGSDSPDVPDAPDTSIPTTGTAHSDAIKVEIDGKEVTFQVYALWDEDGFPTNYVRVRDLALAMNGTKGQFSVDWDGVAVNLVAGRKYTPNGSENEILFSGEDRSYSLPSDKTNVNGAASNLVAFVLTDDDGYGQHTFYQLRDLGEKLGFNVSWSQERGVYIESDKPYVDERS